MSNEYTSIFKNIFLLEIFEKCVILLGMDVQAELITERFLRTHRGSFTARDMERVFASAGVHVSGRDAVDLLESSPLVFSLEHNRYLTKAGAFTGELFSIKPTKQEYNQKMFVAGARCLPFVDSEIPSYALSFFSGDTPLKTKVGEFDSDSAIDMFILYGEEYAPQYITTDPASESSDISKKDFCLPNKVLLTGFDITPLIEERNMQPGDRLLCYVANWDEGKISVIVVHDGNNTFDCGEKGELRLNWYAELEKSMIESFNLIGPCSSIEDQLSIMFFKNRKKLCVSECGSVEEYLNRYAKKVSMEQFGVETRLWHKGEIVPIVGSWNSDIFNASENSLPSFFGSKVENVFFMVLPDVLDQYILDMYFHHKDDLEALCKRIFPEDYVFHRGEKAYIMLNLTERNAILQKQYNWFSDQVSGPLRDGILKLFDKVSEMMYKVDCCAGSIKELPQQELVILSQLYGHLLRLLKSVSMYDRLEEDFDSIMLSIEGMKWNFEDIETVLLNAMEKQRTTAFKVVK